MTMKINKMALAALALGGMTVLPSCDNIDEHDRYIPVEKPVVPTEEVTKNVLIMDFTGHNCTNCPRGAEALHTIQEAYPGQAIVVGLHARGGGPNTTPSYGQDFRTKAAQAIYTIYKPSAFPCAVFNGTETSTETNNWYTIASGMIGEIANMSIKAECDYDEDTRGLTVDYTINMTHDISNEAGYGVMVWIMENGITGYQLDNGVERFDYVHNHVLRAALSSNPDESGDNGLIIGKQFKADDTYRGSASIKLDESWVAENCQVVVYMFDAGNHSVEQSVLVDVTSEKIVEDPHKVPQNLLIMDFTGHNCTNCPRGALALHSIQEAYPKTVAVGLHARGGGPNTTPSYGQDFRTKAAQAIYTIYKPSAFPCAVFNGTEVSTETNQWYTIATSAQETETNMTIDASTSFNLENRKLSVDYYVDFTEDVEEDLSIMVWVMENNIVGYQLDNGVELFDYVHNHVLRASLSSAPNVNGDNGEPLGKSFLNGQTVKGSVSTTLEEGWVAENCQVVVYTFNSETKSVRQCTISNISVPKAE